MITRATYLILEEKNNVDETLVPFFVRKRNYTRVLTNHCTRKMRLITVGPYSDLRGNLSGFNRDSSVRCLRSKRIENDSYGLREGSDRESTGNEVDGLSSSGKPTVRAEPNRPLK